jgi:hypothetical protein
MRAEEQGERGAVADNLRSRYTPPRLLQGGFAQIRLRLVKIPRLRGRGRLEIWLTSVSSEPLAWADTIRSCKLVSYPVICNGVDEPMSKTGDDLVAREEASAHACRPRRAKCAWAVISMRLPWLFHS